MVKRFIESLIKEVISDNPSIVQTYQKPQTNNIVDNKTYEDSLILVATIWGEARGEGEEGMKAVLNVILNRSNRDITKSSEIALKPKQFSFWNKIPNPIQYSKQLFKNNNDGTQNNRDQIMYKKAFVLVDSAIKKELKDNTDGAQFYFNPKLVNPSWSKNMIKTTSIGHHDFYKLKPKKINENLKNFFFPNRFWMDPDGEIIRVPPAIDHDQYVLSLYGIFYKDALNKGWYRGVKVKHSIYLTGRNVELNKSVKEKLEDWFYQDEEVNKVYVETYKETGTDSRLVMSKDVNDLTESVIGVKRFPYKFWLTDKGEIIKLDKGDFHDAYVSKYFNMEDFNQAFDFALRKKWYRGQRVSMSVYLIGDNEKVNQEQKVILEEYFYEDDQVDEIVFENDKMSKGGKKVLMSKSYQVNENKLSIKNIKQMITEGIKEKTAEDFLKKSIQGTEWDGKIYAVGGYVRDELSGVSPKDLDILVDKPNGGIEFGEWLCKKMGNYKEGSNPVIASKFGTAKISLRGVIHNGIDLSGFEIEAVMPRAEKYTPGSRKPDVVHTDLRGDAERRDINFNALFKNITTGEILDLTGKGKEDLEKGIIRTPLDPDKTFTDDPLRMMRIVRFYSKYGYKIPLYILRSLKKNASQLQNISSERITDELNKMLTTTRPQKAMKLLKITGLLEYIIPEFKSAYKMTQNVHHKHNVFDHILDVLSKTEPVLIQRISALFHDIGKTVTRTVEPETGNVHFYGHEDEGEKIVDSVMTRLKYPTELIDAVKLGVKNHMRLKHGGDTAIKLSDKSLLKFRNQMGDQLDNILKVIHADNIAHADASAMPNQIANVRQRLEKLKEIPLKPKLPISGNDLKEMGIKPGPIFSEILKTVTDMWYQNPNLSKEEAVDIAKNIAKI